MTRLFSIPVAIAAVAALASSAVAAAPKPPDPVAVGKTVDKLIAQENGQTKTRDAGVVNDLAFLRRVATLSERERQVLHHLVGGGPSKEIGRALAISPRTVEIYRAKLMTKTQAGSLQELVRWAVLAGLA